MAKLYFRYGAMNSGKTTLLLQTAYNYEERGQKTIIIKPSVDTKGNDNIISRLGVERKVDHIIDADFSLLSIVDSLASSHCILVDECQFLTPYQVEELFYIAVSFSVPVICYGLRTDYNTKPFPGSSRLLDIAHSIEELKTICRCGSKAIFNSIIENDVISSPDFSNGQVLIDDGHYVSESLCGKCYIELGGKLLKNISND